MQKTILIVDDEAEIRRLVAFHLRSLGCEIVEAASGEAALEAFEGGSAPKFDLVVLDLGLPGIDGLEVCRHLRARKEHVPVLMLTARSAEVERVLGLETGADDYLTKPFGILELVARVKAILRRVDAMREPLPQDENSIESGGLTINVSRRRVNRRGQTLSLTAREFDLLLHFARHPGRVYTRQELLDSVWGYGYSGYEHTVNSHINRLRSKIEQDPGEPRFIQTVWGVGYRFLEDGEPES